MEIAHSVKSGVRRNARAPRACNVRRDEIARIAIETTGLADPVPILATLMSDPVAASAYRLDGIVTVVDPVNGAALNPGAPVVAAIGGVIDPRTKIPDVAGWLNAAAYQAHEHHHHDPNRHDAAISAFCVTLDQKLDWPAMAMWLEMLVASRGENLLRVKGILNLKGHDRPVAIHAVRHLMHPPAKLAAWPEGEPGTSRLVFITRDLPRSVIEEGLRAFQAAGGSGCRPQEALHNSGRFAGD